MSVTVMPNSKWQPSVLHLLPFSPNDAGASNSNSSLTNSNVPPTASYIQEEVRGFPALAISPQDKEKLRFKSAGLHDKSALTKSAQTKQSLVQQHASSDKERIAKPRAKSDYGINASRKPEVVKFSINDINEQILGRSRQSGEMKSVSPDSTSFRGEGSETRIRPLPKPALKSREGRRPNTRFWRSSCISPGELELQKHKQHLDIHTSTTRKSRRVKLNIRDLPRSKTPIGENDPDKLNMKHVIAFLQSNAELKNSREGAATDDLKVQVNSHPKSNQALEEIEGKENKPYQGSTVTSYREPTRSGSKRLSFHSEKSSPTENLTETVKDSDSGLDQNPANLAVTANGISQYSSFLVRPGSYQTDSFTSVAYLDKQTGSDYKGMRPKSLNQLHERTEFRLPANLRHIRESANDSRPFRLHRFLTLVSNTSGSVNFAPVTKSFHQNDCLRDKESPSRHRSQTSLSRTLMRSSSKAPRIDSRLDSLPRSEPKRSKSEAGRYLLSHRGNGTEEIDDAFRRRAKSQESHYPKESLPRTKQKNKIICLPVAPVEVESDEDYNPLPSVPGRLDRKDLVLSAQGRAIIAKHFPPTSKLGKYVTRPHSVKEVMRSIERRSEQLPSDQQRPHSMKNIKIDYNNSKGKQEEELNIDTGNVNPETTSPKSTDWGQNISSEAVIGDTSGAEEEGMSNGANSSDRRRLSPSSPFHSERKSQRSKSSSSKSKNGEGFIIFPTEVNDFEGNDFKGKSKSFHGQDTNSQDNLADNIRNVNPSARNGFKNKQEALSSQHSVTDPVKLTLRKERNLTRELTYMVDMEMGSTRSRKTGSGSNGFST